MSSLVMRAASNVRTVAFLSRRFCPASRSLQPRSVLRPDDRGIHGFYTGPPWMIGLPNFFPPSPPPPPIIMNDDDEDNEDKILRDRFMAVFPDIVEDLTDTGRYPDVPGVTEWIAELVKYNVPGGKLDRGLALVHSYKMFCPKSELNDENLQLIYVLGWCIEILQTYQLMLDDIMDFSIIRRGRPCWYRHNDIGLIAINDGILLEQTIYQLLNKYFKDKPYYTCILELFHDITMKSSIGQCLDMLVANSFKFKKFSNFTMENYAAIVKYKTAYYSFVLPVCLAMHMANMDEISQQAKTILLEMGHLFQVQDDFLDCFGNPSVTGKIGTDIADGKCSWLTVVALQNANSEQKLLMEENFNIDDPTNIQIIKNLYEELKLPNTYHMYEEENYHRIYNNILQLPEDSKQYLFFKFLKKLPKRVF